MKWHPIETAPKDGTFILLCGGTYEDDYIGPVHVSMVARWENATRTYPNGNWMVCVAEGGYAAFIYENPTGWMPLSELPGVE